LVWAQARRTAFAALWPEAFALALLISAVLALLGGFKSGESGRFGRTAV
jgi:hypothetical protein